MPGRAFAVTWNAVRRPALWTARSHYAPQNGGYQCGRWIVRGVIHRIMWIVGGLRQLEFALRLLEILRGDPIVVGVLAITPGDHVKGALVLPHGLGIVFRGEAYVGGPGQCGCIVGAGVGTGMLVDVERATGERLRLFEFGVGGLILTVEHSEGEIRAGGGDIHVGLGIHARMFEDPQRFVEFIDCLPPAVRLAEQHRPVVVEGGKTAIVRPVGAACRVECLFEQILGLVEIAGGPLRCGRVDERGAPRPRCLRGPYAVPARWRAG